VARIVFHVDLDSFYTAVEVREHPEMEGKAIIGGAQGSGVVMAFGDDCPSDCRQPFEPICR
jgi:nucleotidyltransferase/DNA polymerase involved in DNA repair